MKPTNKHALRIVLASGLIAFSALAVEASEGGGDASKGKAVYEGTCVFCHGKNGKGEIPGTPDFTKATGVLSQADAVLIDHISNGFESENSSMPMPAKGGNEDLSEGDVENVLAYLHKEFAHR
ncbi:MAG: cytochrome c, class I [Robiginitomaculum sp.]|nr:MAG: cytochrome c, class I [Robiginitomaculum sp.]